MDDLRYSMDRALRHGFAEKMARRYRMPWRLCDYHIARTLGVKGLTPPRFGSLAWKDSRDSQIDGVSPENGESSKDQIPEGGTVLDDDNSNEIPNKSLEVKLEDKNRDEKRSAHYLITDYWNSLEGFFGSLEMAKDRSIGDFTRPVVPLPQKVWQLKTEPTTQEPMWTFATPTAVVCKQETNNNNFLSCPPTNQNVTKT